MLTAAKQSFVPEALGFAGSARSFRVDFRVLRGVDAPSAEFFEMGVVGERESKVYTPSDWKYSELGENGNPPSRFCPVWAVPAVLMEGVRVSVVLDDPQALEARGQGAAEGEVQGSGLPEDGRIPPCPTANPVCTVRLGPPSAERAGHFDSSYAEVPTLAQPIGPWVTRRRLLGDVDALDQTRDPIFMEQVEYLKTVLQKQDQEEEKEGGLGEFGVLASGSTEEGKAVRHFLEYGGREGRGAESYVFYFILPAGFELEIF